MEIFPIMMEGAVICKIQKRCDSSVRECTSCQQLAVYLHNWLLQVKLRYAIFDMQEETEICPCFLEELTFLRKRLKMPFLFAGVVDRARKLMEDHRLFDRFPFFITPEDAIRTMRLHYPGITEQEMGVMVHLGHPLSHTWNISNNGFNPIFVP